jgi:FtsZ-binding cell division protein ZapB
LSRRVLEESDEAFQSRILTALYEFVRAMSMEVLGRREDLIVVAYSDEIARIEEEKNSLREELERRDRQIKQLEEENKRLMALQVGWYHLSSDIYQQLQRDPA